MNHIWLDALVFVPTLVIILLTIKIGAQILKETIDRDKL